MNQIMPMNGRRVIKSRHITNSIVLNRKGDVYTTTQGDVEIISYNNALDVVGKFLNTGYVFKTRIGDIKHNKIKNYLLPSVHGIGYLGNEFKYIRKTYDKQLVKRIYNKWADMIYRCYIPSCSNYDIYGGAGITVDKKWHDFSEFFYDFINLDGYDEDMIITGLLYLDKDKLQQNVDKNEMIYSKNTCCLLTMKEQCQYIDYDIITAKSAKKFIAIHPDGTETEEINIRRFAEKYNLIFTNVSACIRGERKSHKGYKFKPYI